MRNRYSSIRRFIITVFVAFGLADATAYEQPASGTVPIRSYVPDITSLIDFSTSELRADHLLPRFPSGNHDAAGVHRFPR